MVTTGRVILLGEEMLALADWFHGHDFELHISPTGIGDHIVAKCRECEREIDITCYDRW
jgi:hypothetical protein